MNAYEVITNKIIEKMEQGQVPWRKPWKFQTPRNLISKRPYHGINLLMLTMSEYDTPYWLTFKQSQELGGTVKKGEHGTPVIFWKLLKRTEDTPADKEAIEQTEGKTASNAVKTIPYLQYYTLFNLSQTEGIATPENGQPATEPRAACEAIITSFTDRPETVHTMEPRAYYRPATDIVHMPSKTSFISPEEYYSTLFHEYTHATGHEKRLNRHAEEHTNFDFGSKDYSREELVAELGSAFLCAEAGIDNSVIDNNTAYLQSWLRELKADNKLIISASARASKAVDYILKRKEVKE